MEKLIITLHPNQTKENQTRKMENLFPFSIYTPKNGSSTKINDNSSLNNIVADTEQRFKAESNMLVFGYYFTRHHR